MTIPDARMAPPLAVLVVDSDPKLVHELAAALRARGCEPLEATSFEAAKQYWIAKKPPILIADVRLGQFNGLQLLLRAKADRPDVTVLITCSTPDKVLEVETQRFGATFLVKPIQADEVVAALLSSYEAANADRPDRRTAERRRLVTPDFLPNRRFADRRRPISN